MILLLLLAAALAETSAVLGRGERTVYVGAGASSFQYGASGELRDRQVRLRLDGYAAAGVAEGVQLAASLPLLHVFVVDLPDRPPAPCGDYCAATTRPGELAVGARVALREGLSAGLWAHADPWNAGVRGRWTNTGQGAVGFVPELLGRVPLGRADLVGWARYDLVVGEKVAGLAGRLPHDAASGGLQLGTPAGPVRLEGALTGYTRLGGSEFGADWAAHTPDEWLWAELRYRELRAQAKLSVPLGASAGLHLAAGRVAWARNGPKDAWDVSVGVHRWWDGPIRPRQ